MKGIILAAGKGARLSPATLPISKILLPIYDRPMVYYPLTTLMMAGIKDILIITNETDLENFRRTLGDGSQFGVSISYTVQYVQRGISDAFIIAEDFIAEDRVCLILGDNIFYGPSIEEQISSASSSESGATVFGIRVPDPERFGVVEFDKDMKAISLEEKPKEPKSDYAVVGIYFYDSKVSAMAKTLKPSARGELEITDLNRLYLERNELEVRVFDEITEWIDAGTFDSLLSSSEFIRDKERELGRKILCPEIVALEKGFVSKERMGSWLDSNRDNEYFSKIREQMS